MTDVQVLIVDDILNWQDALTRLLSSFGYSCDTASSTEEAVGLLGKQSYKLAIVDIRLREDDVDHIGGLEIVKWITDTRSNTKVIVVTGYGSIGIATRVLRSGVVVGFF